MELFLIKDEKVGFLNCTIESVRDLAKLKFGASFATQEILIGRCEDYSLYAVGRFDVVDGIKLYDAPVFITNGLSAYNKYMDSISQRKCRFNDNKECDCCGSVSDSTEKN